MLVTEKVFQNDPHLARDNFFLWEDISMVHMNILIFFHLLQNYFYSQ
tara:strand:+ start:44962 stop:45102 length:141 start_codon:yes stop_codon:yes gene_type:complete